MSEPDRTNLPIRRLPFQGVSKKTLDGSKPDWNLIGHPEAPPGSPNVLLVLIDDAGFGNPSTFGGPISTPRYTQMAEAGLRYNRFHVTALCSPTRGAHRRQACLYGPRSSGEMMQGPGGPELPRVRISCQRHDAKPGRLAFRGCRAQLTSPGLHRDRKRM